MSRLSEHDEFMAEEDRAYDRACRLAAKRGHFLPGPPLGPGRPAATPKPQPALKPAAAALPSRIEVPA